MPIEHEEPWANDTLRGSDPCEAMGRPATKRQTAACDGDLPNEGQVREDRDAREGHLVYQMREACQGCLA